MKKKVLAATLAVTLGLSIAACGSSKEVVSQKEVTAVDSETEAVKETDIILETETILETENDDSNVGEIIEENGLRKQPVITDKELNHTGETGPFKYSIKAIQVSKLTATNNEMAEMLEIEKDKEVTLVVMDVSIENTTDATNYIYFDQATLTTNTKEQVETDWMLSDYIDGEYLGSVVHEGAIFYILKNTNADELTNIKLYVDAPHDENFETIGEEVVIDLVFE